MLCREDGGSPDNPALQNVALEGTSGTVSLGHGPSVWGLVTATSLL